MFARSISRALHNPSIPLSTLPPTFLLPLRATLTTTTSTTTTDPNPPTASYTHHPTPQTPTNAPPPDPHSPPSPPPSRWPPQLSRRSPLPPPPSTPGQKPTANLALLAAQPPHYITAHLHSRPYLLTTGDTLRLPFHLPHAPPGTTIRLTRASLLGSRDYTLRGDPYVDEGCFVCRAVVTGVEGEPMRVVEKTKQRQRRVRRVRSKMRCTVLRVVEVRVLTGGEEGEGREGREGREEGEEGEVGR